jgi:hypothetical protein
VGAGVDVELVEGAGCDCTTVRERCAEAVAQQATTSANEKMT